MCTIDIYAVESSSATPQGKETIKKEGKRKKNEREESRGICDR